MRWYVFALTMTLSAVLTAQTPAPAAAPKPAPPAYLDLRWDENWSYLRDKSLRRDYADPLKYIPLAKPGWYVSLGAESRTRYELFRNASFGVAPETPKGFLIQRYLGHADFHFGNRVRLYTQLQSGIENGRNGGPRATDLNKMEIHQGFFDFATSDNAKKAVTFRIGRQELEFGSGHFFSASEVFNVRRSFDGARVFFNTGKYTWNALAVRPVESNREFFDDAPDHTQAVWAAGVFGPNPVIKKGNISLYYIGYDRKRNVFDKGAGRETRHTTGSRIWGSYKSFDYNYEVLFQTGHFRGGPILALGVATDTGFTKAKWRFSPRFSLRSDTASGDRNHNDNTLGTFNPMFPSTAYSGKIGLIGAANVFDITPNVRLRLHKRLYFLPEASTFFRESTADGIYSVTSTLQKTGQKSQARYIGSQASAPFQFTVNRHITYTALITRFWAGQFLKETPPGRSVTYFTTFVTYKF